MQIHDPEIIRIIEQIGEHYRTNIANPYIRPALLQLRLEKQDWDLIDILVGRSDQLSYHGIYLEELYMQLCASANFVAMARRDLVPNLRHNRDIARGSETDKVFRDMAVINFGANLKVFADLVNELYVKLVDLDRAEAKGRIPVYTQIQGLQNIGHLLVEG